MEGDLGVNATPLLAPGLRWAIVVLAAVTGAAAGRFAWRQNRKKALGGPMSAPKVIWLFFAVYFWFFVCPLLALEGSLPQSVRWGLGLFAASMWIRGAAEMYLLYVTRSWRPPMGIAHDAFCILLVAGALIQTIRSFAPLATFWWGTAWLVLVLLTLFAEIAFALLFFRAVEGRTTGGEGLWFADDTARFRFINRLTLTVEIPLILALATLLGVASRQAH
jgi:hypothetical protein